MPTTKGVFRLCLYNPLSLVRPGRLVQIAEELHADAVFLPGTRIREWEGRTYHTQELENGAWAIHSGWARAPLTNRSAGCAWVLGRRFRKSHVKKIQTPDKGLQGRGLCIRLQGRGFDIKLIGAYPPPMNDSTGKRAVAVKAAQETMKWCRRLLADTP